MIFVIMTRQKEVRNFFSPLFYDRAFLNSSYNVSLDVFFNNRSCKIAIIIRITAK